MQGIFRPRHVSIAALAGVAVVAVLAGWLTTSSLQQDFAAYWTAGAARRAGLDPYVNHVGGSVAPELWDGVAVFAHSRFLYPPLVADLFRPLACLPYAAAKAVFTALALAAWGTASVLAARLAGARHGTAPVLIAGALAYPLYLHLERGQVDLFLLVLLVVALDGRTRPGLGPSGTAGPATHPAPPAAFGGALGGAALAAAATFKPVLLALVPVLAALGRWRAAGAAVVGATLVVLATALVSGPVLLREYATDVLPRVALYGEGGDETMLLPEGRLATREADLEAGVARLDGRVYRQSAWDGPASASLPRLLAPERPSRLVTRLTAAGLLAGLIAAALVVRRRGREPADEALISWAAAIACVVGSPAGWSMGLVWALPLVPWLARLRGEGGGGGREGGRSRCARRAAPTRSPRAFWLAVAAGVACALPPLFPGWAALAGTALVVTVVTLALAGRSGAAVAA